MFKDEKKKLTYRVGFGEKQECNNLALPVFFFLLLVFVACRAESVGTDTSNYRYIFEKSNNLTIKNIFAEPVDCLFRLFNYLCYKISRNFRVYLIITAFISIAPIGWYYCKDRRHSPLKIALFVNMSTFVMLFSGIRQMLAISLGVLAFCCLKNNKKIMFFIIAIVCTFIHNSGFMIFFLFPLYYLRLKKKHLYVLIPLIGVVFIFNRRIFGFLTAIMSRFNDKFEAEITSTGAVTMLFVFAIFLTITYFICDEKKMDEESLALRNILVFTVILQCFAPLHMLAMRMNYYFIIFVPITMGNALSISKDGLKSITQIIEIGLTVFFIFYFCYTVATQYVIGESVLDVVPYVPFWAE